MHSFTQQRTAVSWMFSRNIDLAVFFVPAVIALAGVSILSGAARINSTVMLLLLTQGFGIGPLHLGLSWFHYADKRNLAHYTKNENKLAFVWAPLLAVPITTLLFLWQSKLVLCAYVLWTIQHLVQQNLGILLLYQNHNSSEISIDRSILAKTLHSAAAFFAFVFLYSFLGNNPALQTVVSAILILTGVETTVSCWNYVKSVSNQLILGKRLNIPATAMWLLAMVFFLPFAVFKGSWDTALFFGLIIHWCQYIGLNWVLTQRKYPRKQGWENLFVPVNPILLLMSIGTFVSIIVQL